MRVFRAASLIILLSSTSLIAQQLQLVFLTDRDHTLPGLSVAFRLTATNTSDRAVALPATFALRVTTADGTTFLPDVAESRHFAGWPIEYADRFVIPAHESQTYVTPAFMNGFFRDARMSTPGRYRLQLVIDIANETLVTNAITVTIDEPTGDDAKVWRWMQDIAGKRWGVVEWSRFGEQLEDYVFANYPQSQYAPFLFFWRPPAQKPGRLDVLTRLHATGAFADWIQCANISNDVEVVRDELRKQPAARDASRAMQAALHVDNVLSALQQNTKDDFLRVSIQKAREFIPSPEVVRATLAQNH